MCSPLTPAPGYFLTDPQLSGGRYNDARERNRLCIEVCSPLEMSYDLFLTLEQDPFEVDYNVARCVTKDGLYTVCKITSP